VLNRSPPSASDDVWWMMIMITSWLATQRYTGPLDLLGNRGLLLQSLDLILDLLDAALETRPLTGDGILTTDSTAQPVSD